MRMFCFFLCLTAGILTACPLVYADIPAPKLIEPCDGASVLTTVLFKWEESEADSYTLQILDWNTQTEIFKYTTTKNQYKLPINTLKKSTPYYWRMKVSNASGKSDWSSAWNFRTLPDVVVPFQMEKDSDHDGIPDRIEDTLHTNINKKTLFVRPKIEIGFGYDYWVEFIALFPDKRPGFARITSFENAGIEIVVIGPCSTTHENDKCHEYKKFDDFYYNPAHDPIHPPCDIMEIVYKMKENDMGDGIFCAYYSFHKGHTFFSENGSTIVNGEEEDAPTWSWDTKGYTPKGEKHHGYFAPLIFPFPLDNYFNEGAYKSIEKGIVPAITDCKKQHHKCKGCSPMNLNKNDSNPLYTSRPDETVEFNEICFESNGKITNKPARVKGYDRDTVLRRTIVHEMGHALLTADKEDHCKNPMCIMYERTLDWKMHDFGPCSKDYCCEHRPGGAKDIRRDGVVHNTARYK